jgi:hypothetical protein
MSGISNELRTLGDEKLEALVEVMLLAASADGDFSDIERTHFLNSVESLTDGRIAHARLETHASNGPRTPGTENHRAS